MTSIVGQHLEHARVFIFENNGNPEYYTGSADWMKRNLSKRVEIIFPINDPDMKKRLKDYINMQIADNVKSRKINRYQTNDYIKNDLEKINSQNEFRNYLKGI